MVWFLPVGQEAWLRKLKWPKMKEFSEQKWNPLYVGSKSTETAAFHKSYDNLNFFWILKAGHMVSDLCALEREMGD